MSAVAERVPVRRKVTPVQFGARLRELREAAGLTLRDMAARVGKSYATVSQWEAGNTSPNFVDVVKIAAVLGQPVDAFAVIPTTIPERPMGRKPKPKPADDGGE